MNKIIHILLLSLVSLSAAHGAVIGVTESTSVQLKRGTSNVGAAYTSQALCDAEANRLWNIEGQTRVSGTATYACGSRKWVVRFGPATCPAKPADETRPQLCPTGTTGTWSQIRTYITAPAPTCWTPREWTPAAAPAGACVPVVTPPPPPATETWTRCAAEGEVCQYTGIKRVRYGADPHWVLQERSATDGGIPCTNEVFGDPIYGTEKACWISSEIVSEPPPPVTGRATVSWNAVTQCTDGTACTITGYRIIYGTSALDRSVQAPANTTSHTISELPAGTWQFSVIALSASAESLPGTAATKVIQ